MAASVDTQLQSFDSPFSTPSPGIEDENQDNVQFDYTDVPDSPSVETRLEDIGAETEVLDELECIGEEIVLDSDDEGANRTDVSSVMKGRHFAETQRSTAASTQGYVGCLRKQRNTVGPQTPGVSFSPVSSLSDKGNDCDPQSVHKVAEYQPDPVNENGTFTVEEQMNDRILNKINQDCDSLKCNAKGSGVVDERKSSDMTGKVSSANGENVSLVTSDHDVASLSFIDSQEPGDLPQALDFVDHYLSVIDLNLPQEIGNRKKNTIKSPPALSARGPQSLARRANLITKFQASRSFDWDENLADDGGYFVSRRRKEPVLDSKRQAPKSMERNLSEGCEKLKGGITNSTSAESRFMVHNSNVKSETVQAVSITKMDTNFVAELDKQSPTKSSGQQQENDVTEADATEIFDVGFDTQMAAEAMEELLHAPFPNNNATIILEDPPKEELNNKVISSFNERPATRLLDRRYNRTKRYENKLSSSPGTTAENQKMLNLDKPNAKKGGRGKRQTENMLNLDEPKAILYGRSSEIIVQREQGTLKRKKDDTNISTPKPAKHNPLPKKQYTGTFSPIACRTRRNSSACSLKSVECSGSNHDVKEVRVSKRRRNVNTDEFHMFEVRKKCPSLGSKISRQATKSKINQNEKSDPLVAASLSLNSDMWTFPKRKRAPRGNRKSEVDPLNSILCYDAAENMKLDVSSDTKVKVSTLNDKRSFKLPLLKELSRLGFTNSLPDFTSKDLRRRRTMANACVLFSQNLDNNIIKQQRKILTKLGISVALCCSDATHFVADKFARTSNMLEAIAAGKPVVTHLWLESCAQAACLVDEKMYILRDAKKEKEIGFSMPISLARAKDNPLLKGRRVLTTPNVKPGKQIIESLIKAVHGQALVNCERDVAEGKFSDDFFILSCEEDYSICESFLEKGVAVYSSELLLNGIITQKLDYNRYGLFIDHVKRNRSKNNTLSRKSKVASVL